MLYEEGGLSPPSSTVLLGGRFIFIYLFIFIQVTSRIASLVLVACKEEKILSSRLQFLSLFSSSRFIKHLVDKSR